MVKIAKEYDLGVKLATFEAHNNEHVAKISHGRSIRVTIRIEHLPWVSRIKKDMLAFL